MISKTKTLLLLMLIISLASSAKKAIRIDQAVQKGLIKVAFTPPEGFTGKVMQIKITNLGKKSLDLDLPAGMKLDSQENSEQDLIVTKGANIELAGSSSKQYKVYAMCCQAHNGCPKNGYSFLGMADSNIVKLAQYIDKTDLQNSTGQSAMWCLSDNNPLESITGNDVKKTNALREFMSKLTGKKVLPFFIEYENPDAPTFSGRPARMTGTYEYNIDKSAKVSFGIYNEAGVLMMSAFTDRAVTNGKHKFNFEFKAAGLPQGKYYARLTFDSLPKQELEFVM